VLDLVVEPNLGAAVACGQAGDCERATAATILFRPHRPDRALEGIVDLTFPTHGRVAGGFRATWRSEPAFCG
jgi:hypothetical protein